MVQPKQVSNDTKGATTRPNPRLSECYERGLILANSENNFDYAHAMFTECVLHDPGNLRFVEAMIQNLRAKTPRRKKSRFISLRRSNSPLRKFAQREEWSDVLRIGIDLLNVNPWDVATLGILAEACAARHHNDVELVYLKQALDSEPKNIEVNRHCARSLGRMGQFDQAIACWHRVEKLTGKDEEAARMISLLAEEKLKYPGGRPPTAQKKETPAGVPDDMPRQVVVGPRQILEQAIAHDPHDASNYIKLADFLSEANQIDAAEALLSRAIAACGDQNSLVKKLKQVRLLRAEEQRSLAEERVIEQQINDTPIRIPWLELGLAVACFAIVVQLVPVVRSVAESIVDFRKWSQIDWFLFNIFVLLVLITVRYRPELRTAIRQRQNRKNGASNLSR